MKKPAQCIFFALTAFTSLAAYSQVECPKLDAAQERVLQSSWQYGEEKMGKGWGVKLSAMAFQESSLGANVKGKGSHGVFQMRPSTVAFMNDVEPTGKNLKNIRKRLNNSFEFSAQEAHKYLDYWSEKGYSDRKVYMRWNGGYSNSTQSQVYSKSVQSKIKMFNQCYTYRNGVVHANTIRSS
ncbi:hypothetical protein Arno162_5 [Pectobacterium phage Arno162]|uniref:Transglycosylase SLT domain-containing protein n=1 Tax=Pectobacterium phage Arno162 TaxID=2500577 RepID=A0A678ZZ14_9CAUD|nr:hypothetical protein Arno162_5 [Pectobacterium phage Arno162]